MDGVNPFISQSGIAWESFRLCYNFLTWYDADYKPVPDAAESWEVAPDGLTWTFHLRPDLKWSDGRPLTARDEFTRLYDLDEAGDEAAERLIDMIWRFEELADARALTSEIRKAKALGEALRT